MEESDFAVDSSELSTCLHHLSSVRPRSVCLIFLKLSPRVRLTAPNSQVFGEIRRPQSVSSLAQSRSSEDVHFFPFHCVLELDGSAGQKARVDPRPRNPFGEGAMRRHCCFHAKALTTESAARLFSVSIPYKRVGRGFSVIRGHFHKTVTNGLASPGEMPGCGLEKCGPEDMLQ